MRVFSQDVKAQVLNATDIVDLIGAYVQLKPKGGSRYLALCPFHVEKTPSFNVNRDRQTYKCFGCGKGGDAFSFLMETEGLTFPEALERLADRAGIKLQPGRERSDAAEYKRKQLFDFLTMAAKLYRDTLLDKDAGLAGREYLAGRALKDETVARFNLGYVPDKWSTLVDAARLKNVDSEIQELSGMVKRGDSGTYYDFFRHRVIFPIRDLNGKTIAFGGRDLGDSPAKYINSPESPVYKKNRVLYGLHEAREAMRKANRAILVEGYFDLLQCFDAGVENVVATCGTALTLEQAKLVRRYVPEVVLVYDGDSAGIKAAMRGIGVLFSAGLAVRALLLPEGQDPDDFIRHNGPEAFAKRVEAALDVVTFFIQSGVHDVNSIEGKTELAKEVFAILKHIPDRMRQDEYVKRMAYELRIDEWRCRSEFQKFLRDENRRDRFQAPQTSERKHYSRDDCELIAALLAYEELLNHHADELEELELGDGPVARIFETMREGAGPDLLHRLGDDETTVGLYTEASVFDAPDESRAQMLVKKWVASKRRATLQAEAVRVQTEIDEAARAKDESRVSELLMHKIGIQRKIEEVGAV